MSADPSFFRSLAAMHRAGIPWPRAVESAGGGSARFEPVVRDLDRGKPLAEALRPVVDRLDLALLEAGERSGTLERALDQIADLREGASRARGEARQGLLYPLLVAHLAAILLPLPDLIQGRPVAALLWALAVLVPTWGGILLARRWSGRPPPGPEPGDPPDPPPYVGPLRNRTDEADARAFDALGRLHDAGVPLLSALDLAVAAGWGGRAAVDLAEARRRVGRGRDLGGAWQRVPADLAARFRSAEEAGELPDALFRAADEMRFRIRLRRSRTAAVLPVVVLLAVGALVAVRLFAFYAKLYRDLPF